MRPPMLFLACVSRNFYVRENDQILPVGMLNRDYPMAGKVYGKIRCIFVEVGDLW